MDGGTEIATALHRFSVQDYRWMAETGMFDSMRVELIRGAILDMPPIGTPHVLAVMQLIESLAPLLVGKRARLSVQSSIRLDERSEPEPDLALLSWDGDRTLHPAASAVLLLIEVADSTLAFDRSVKGPLYAAAGIGEYWIVNLVDRVIEVHRQPGPNGYQQVFPVASRLIEPLALEGFTIAVEDVLPPVAP